MPASTIIHMHRIHALTVDGLPPSILACSATRLMSDPSLLKRYPEFKKIIEFVCEFCVVALQVPERLPKWSKVLDLIRESFEYLGGVLSHVLCFEIE
jgi:hypothetical protein